MFGRPAAPQAAVAARHVRRAFTNGFREIAKAVAGILIPKRGQLEGGLRRPDVSFAHIPVIRGRLGERGKSTEAEVAVCPLSDRLLTPIPTPLPQTTRWAARGADQSLSLKIPRRAIASPSEKTYTGFKTCPFVGSLVARVRSSRPASAIRVRAYLSHGKRRWQSRAQCQ